jgi:hypothetical protein
LFDAYAHCADRRDVEGQKALFTIDTRFAVYMDGEGTEPTYVLDRRDALTPVFADLIGPTPPHGRLPSIHREMLATQVGIGSGPQIQA